MFKSHFRKIRSKFTKAGYPGVVVGSVITPTVYFNTETDKWISFNPATGEVKKGFIARNGEDDGSPKFVEFAKPFVLTFEEIKAIVYAARILKVSVRNL